MRYSTNVAAANRRLTMERLETRLAFAASDLRITEFLASNEDDLRDYDGEASDWIEIFNAGSTPVSLSGMYLTDNAANRTKWRVPTGVVIPAGGYQLVFASDKNKQMPNGELHANFKLSADGEYLGLIDANGVTVIDQYAPAFPLQIEDVSYGRPMESTGATTTLLATGAAARAWVPTSSAYDAAWRSVGFNDSFFNISGPTGLGYENSPQDLVNFAAEIATAVPSGIKSLYVRIPFTVSELANVGRLTLRMRYDDGFVAYLNGEKIAEANAPDSPQWNSEATALHDDALAEQFIDFDVSSAIPQLRLGQNVLAIHALNVPAGSDMLLSPQLVAEEMVVSAPSTPSYFESPTPGYGNSESYLGFVERPTFSLPHGFYESPQAVSIVKPHPAAIVVYTTDGSTPTVDGNLTPTNGTIYTGVIPVNKTTVLRAIAFRAGYKPSPITASSYLFLNDVITQSPTGAPPANWPASGVNGQLLDYGIDPEIVAMYGAQAVKDSLASLSSISISVDLDHLFDAESGIYVNAGNRGRDWERLASVEMVTTDGSPTFTVNAGLRIRGGASRQDGNPKHAFRLYFRGEYGDGKLHFPLFGSEGVDEFDVLDLRTEQNFSWSAAGSTQNTFLRDVFARDLQRDLGQPYTRSEYHHLYINGVYWGVFMSQERAQEDFGESYFGGDADDYDVVKADPHVSGATELAAGTDEAWRQLFNLAEQLSTNPVANADNYWTMQGLNPDGTRNPTLPVLLDVDNLVDYMLIIFYTGGTDVGISKFFGDNRTNNWFGIYNRVAADQGFQFFLHDNEHSLGADEGVPHATQFVDRTGPFNFGSQSLFEQFAPPYLHQDLLVHPEYRQRIIDKAQEYFFGDGPMTREASIARMQERIAEVGPAIVAEAARWGDAKTSTPLNKTTWQNEVNWLLNTYFTQRTNTVVNQLRGDWLYVIPPTFSLPGGATPAGASLSLSAIGAGVGAIYFTTDGVTDPRAVGGGINASPEVSLYSNPLQLNQSTTVKARFRSNAGHWSALMEGTFSVIRQGDYNLDGEVSGADFLLWQRQFGSNVASPGAGADGNLDGRVDADDLEVWRQHFPAPAPALAVSLIDAIAWSEVAPMDDAPIEASSQAAANLPESAEARNAINRLAQPKSPLLHAIHSIDANATKRSTGDAELHRLQVLAAQELLRSSKNPQRPDVSNPAWTRRELRLVDLAFEELIAADKQLPRDEQLAWEWPSVRYR